MSGYKIYLCNLNMATYKKRGHKPWSKILRFWLVYHTGQNVVNIDHLFLKQAIAKCQSSSSSSQVLKTLQL